MPLPDKQWRHVIINTRCSWLHGDRRGFRSRGHRIHSSGDYKNPPPIQEHQGLRRFHQFRSGPPVMLPKAVFQTIIRGFVEKLRAEGHRVLAVSISDRHLHALVELPNDRSEIRRIIGKCKQRASHAARRQLPGGIWSEGGEYKPILDRSHHRNVFNYIRTKQESWALIWSILAHENWIDDPGVYP